MSSAAASALVITASYDKQIRFWDAASGRTVRCFVFQDSQINALLLIQDMQALVVAGFGVLRLYDVSGIVSSSSSGAAGAGGAALPTAQQQQTGAGGGGGGGAAGQTQAPPLLSSFESQGSMNFTSLGSFPLRSPSSRKTDLDDGSGRGMSSEDDDGDDTTSSNADALAATMSLFLPAWMAGRPEGPHREVRNVLYATSEDGHIRFFDAKSTTALCLLKDIHTGAAITCSCLSPDRKLLLTGSQIGVVSVWHLPSIVASVSLEQQQQQHGATDLGSLGPEEREQYEALAEDARLFGSSPLQDLSFDGDYTAIRSITVEPLARWAVVATNAGHVHFIRFSHDAQLLGSKTEAGRAKAALGGVGGGGAAAALSWRKGRSVFGMLREDGLLEGSAGGGGGGRHGMGSNDDATTTTSLGHGGGGGGSESPSSAQGPREGVYRSALVVNELSSQARRVGAGNNGSTSPLADGGAAGGAPTTTTTTQQQQQQQSSPGAGHGRSGGSQHTNRSAGGASSSIGAALLNSLGQRAAAAASSTPPAEGSGGGGGEAGASADAPEGAQAPAHPAQPTEQPDEPFASSLQEELELETFYSFPAHYKYILKTAISPDRGLLVTCSADYTIGRFIIPPLLRDLPSTTAATAAATQNAAKAPGEECRSSEDALGPLGQEKTATPSLAGTHNREDTESSAANETSAADIGTAAAVAAAAETATTTTGTSAATEEHAKAAAATAPNQDTAGILAAGAAAAAGGGVGASQRSRRHLFKPLKPLTGHTRWVWDCVISDCGRFLFSCSSDAQVRMWSGLTAERPQSTSFVGHSRPVVAILMCYDHPTPSAV